MSVFTLPKPLSMEKTAELMAAVEGVLAEFGASEPGAVVANGDGEEPAAILLDHLYSCWNDCMTELHCGDPAMELFEPDGIDEDELAALRAAAKEPK